jgi:hypothetical protein
MPAGKTPRCCKLTDKAKKKQRKLYRCFADLYFFGNEAIKSAEG